MLKDLLSEPRGVVILRTAEGITRLRGLDTLITNDGSLVKTLEPLKDKDKSGLTAAIRDAELIEPSAETRITPEPRLLILRGTEKLRTSPARINGTVNEESLIKLLKKLTTTSLKGVLPLLTNEKDKLVLTP